jgi:hypothetical protein
VRLVTANYIITAADEATLDSFYTSDTASGSLSFSWTHPRTNSVVNARFVQPPQYGWVDGYYTAQLQLEILPS